ncbi:MAG: Octanoyltransferase LipM [Verrucomicrobia subdivision 3 bacterium]|nr:Octanoyltransferase LipM [Limisphaerales bacterium]MCS1416320.1 Octanoyltransferase LipM [Limisphaerales bacterium]
MRGDVGAPLPHLNLLKSQFSDPLENLVCDEILLDLCDTGEIGPVIRFWEPSGDFVVLGYGNDLKSEVNCEACVQLGVPVFRRCSGGGTVLQGKGCLSYSLVLPLSSDAALSTVGGTNDFIMERHRKVLESLLSVPVFVRGCTDLTVGDLKFSGNSQRRRRSCLLFHGTFLIDLDRSLMNRLLLIPSRQPKYRLGRAHAQFTCNLPLTVEQVIRAVSKEWGVQAALTNFDVARVRTMARERRDDLRWCCL